MARLDIAQIDQLKFTEMTSEEDLIEPLLELFEHKLDSTLDRITEHVKHSEFYEVGMLAHALKSSSGNLGLVETQTLCLMLEVESKYRHTIDYLELIKQIREMAWAETKILRSYLNPLVA